MTSLGCQDIANLACDTTLRGSLILLSQPLRGVLYHA
jgi:hypothetical protein